MSPPPARPAPPTRPMRARPVQVRPGRALSGAMALLAALAAAPFAAAPVAAADFPAGDERYHTYAELRDDIRTAEAAHPDIVRVFSIGESHEGRELWTAEVSDRVGVDEGEPEVLVDALHHGREHLSAELALASFHWLVDGYGHDARITDIVDGRRVWFVFMVNPDGGEFDIEGGAYRDWRRNRQPTPGSGEVGTDVNRNYAFRWRCCGGASADPASGRYAGPAPFSSPEARAMRDFVESRVVDGRQRITMNLSFHTFGRLVMYPYGFTKRDVPPQMTRLDHRVLVAIARTMAASSRYRAQQSSDLYISSGSSSMWMYGVQRIVPFVVEVGGGARPPDERIRREAARNRDAVLTAMELADCPQRAVGAAAAWCGPFADDLEIDRGWTADPDGSDTAIDGAWVRGVPKRDARQLAGAYSGQGALVTGRRAGRDVDAGVTTIRSSLFRLPDQPGAMLRLRAWVGLDAAAGAEDGLEIRLVDAAGGPLGGALVRITGDGTGRAPAWRRIAVRLPDAAAGRRVAIELRARDAGDDGDATVEVGVDDVRVTAS